MNKVIYSCITGNYDDVPIHKYITPDWEYVLFTDNDKLIKAGHYAHWTIKPLVYNKSSNVKNARWHKVNAHVLFPEYDYSLWLDSNIIVNTNIYTCLEDLIKQNIIVAVPNHPARDCIYDEANIIKLLHIDKKLVVNKEMSFLQKESYPQHNGLSETNILLRKHNALKSVHELWWSMIFKYSKRDQLSFNYCLWKYNITRLPIYTDKLTGFGEARIINDFIFIKSANHNQNKIKQPLYVRLLCCLMPIAKYRKKIRAVLWG